jgi:transitional endoplasmic reticulum ATPase
VVGVADILNRWIGASEHNLVSIFDKARADAPSVLFFDELDALAFSRAKARSEHTRTVVNEFLMQMDTLQREHQNVLAIAATNMPWDVDPAMKRPGRFARQIFVPPPHADTRARMLEVKLAGVPHAYLDLAAIARASENFSGGDLDGLVDLATEYALEDSITRRVERPLQQCDFERAMDQVQASTLDWLQTARNLVKYAGNDRSYRDVESYLKRNKLT